jgi:endonuclease/exonuclease/phosphatase family metal-dependent hydrolase
VARRAVLFSASLALFSGCMRWTPPILTPVSAGSCRSSAFQWFAPEDTRERARLDAWCAGVGAPVIHVDSGAVFSDGFTLHDIVFVSWNVHVGNGDIRSFFQDLRAGVHTEGRRFSHHVMLLQEVVRTTGVPPFAAAASGAKRIAARNASATIDIVEVSRELGTSLVYVPSMRNGTSADPAEDRGSAILSTIPLSAVVAAELPGERQRRVVVIAKAGPISVAVIHLDALGGGRRLRLLWTPWMRDVQIRSTASVLPDGPLVVGADLNTWHGRDELAARFLNEKFRETPLSLERHGLGLRVLDYMFFRGGPGQRGRYRQVDNRYGSDHRPLIGWIE